MAEEIINRVAQSGLVTIDLEEFYPDGEMEVVDIKPWLFMGLILKEKDFREQVAAHDWTQYRDKFTGITCSADAIVPLWAYMLVVSNLRPHTEHVVFGNKKEMLGYYFRERLAKLNPEEYTDKRVVIKGCGERELPEEAYVEVTRLLLPYAKTIMYGEPCSTVPVYKRPK